MHIKSDTDNFEKCAIMRIVNEFPMKIGALLVPTSILSLVKENIRNKK